MINQTGHGVPVLDEILLESLQLLLSANPDAKSRPKQLAPFWFIWDNQALWSDKLFVEAEKLDKMKGKNIPNKGRRAREVIKMGQGGTLDPLADGVLVVGVGKGTKRLSEFLDCTKEYKTTCLLGCETDTYDGEGARVRAAPWHHVTQDQVEAQLSRFSGKIEQTPPIFSALKMDGRPLYEYARKGIPLPRPIEPRAVTVHSLEIVEWLGQAHGFRWPTKALSEEEKSALEIALRGAEENVSLKDEEASPPADDVPTAFVLKMKVSGGTYVRSIVHDLAHAVGSAGHVVTLSRLRQGRFTLAPVDEGDQGCIPWDILKRASHDIGEPGADGWVEWEREVIEHLEVVAQ